MTVGILELCDEVPLEENLVAVVVVHSRRMKIDVRGTVCQMIRLD